MKAWVFGGMLVLCGAMAACSSSGGDSSSSGSGGSGGGDDGSDSDGNDGTGGSAAQGSPTSTSTGSGTTTTGSSPTSTSTGGGECTVAPGFFQDPTCDACALDQCCAELEACVADQANCFTADGTAIDPDSSVGGPLIACLEGPCADSCTGGDDICDTGLATQDPELNACIDANCCPEFIECFGAAGENLDACNACIEAGGGPECDNFLACADEFCAGSQVCDTGISFGDPDVDACVGDACCAEYQDCVADDPDACLECLNGGGGPLCDAALACTEESGCIEG